ncbi:MAG: hypothetical protein WBD98_05430, partial [Acidobacteriaceae bacterium]
VPRPNHESGLPCHCPPCEERLQSHIRRFEVRPRKRSVPTIDNPLCPSGNSTCLGPASEFACRACRRLRNPAPRDPDTALTDPTNDPDPVPDSRCPDPGPGVIPDSRYPEDSAK